MISMEILRTMSSFLTPVTLFLLLNLVIATIFLSSRRHVSSADTSAVSFAGPILRTTSPVLDRLKSFTLHRFRSGEIPSPDYTHNSSSSSFSTELGPDLTVGSSDDAFTAAGSTNTTVFSNSTLNPPPTLVRTSSILHRFKSTNLYRYCSGEIQTQQENADVAESEPSENADMAKPEKKKKKTKTKKSDSSLRRREPVVEDLDARADDFISKFKENLKIQRLNSILNYTEMLNRGR